jgi:hypothetical protein
MVMQPFRKGRACDSSGDFDCGITIGVVQTHEDEIQMQRCDCQIRKFGGDSRRLLPCPHRRDGRQRHNISEHSSELDNVGTQIYSHLSIYRCRAFAERRS